MNIISFFSGCGGMDLGFKQAGFKIIWANDNAVSIQKTFKANFPDTALNTKSIAKLDKEEIPSNIIGIIGGPPCQSWSVAGSGRGLVDKRGLLFFNYINIIEEKQPLFFVAENVEGLVSGKNKGAFSLIKSYFENAGYVVKVKVLNAADYNVPQQRKRVFFVGYRYDLPIEFKFPNPSPCLVSVRDAIFDLKDTAIQSKPKNQTNSEDCIVPNHEYWQGPYSYIFLSRNRVLSWDKQSFTLQASGRQMSIHPQAPLMEKIAKDVRIFKPGFEQMYRRLTIRECARIQTFPDNFVFHYQGLNDGYKMIGNSVPVNLAHSIATQILTDLKSFLKEEDGNCI